MHHHDYLNTFETHWIFRPALPLSNTVASGLRVKAATIYEGGVSAAWTVAGSPVSWIHAAKEIAGPVTRILDAGLLMLPPDWDQFTVWLATLHR